MITVVFDDDFLSVVGSEQGVGDPRRKCTVFLFSLAFPL